MFRSFSTLILFLWCTQGFAYELAPIARVSNHYTYSFYSKVPKAQQFAQQGLIQFWDFQFAEATRSFQGSIDADPDCGMCYYFLGLSAGSAPMGPITGNERAIAVQAISDGLKRPVLTERARMLLQALANRYYLGRDQSTLSFHLGDYHLTSLNERESYSEAMKDIAKKFSSDHEIQAQYAFSLFDIDRHHLWNEHHQPQRYTTELGHELYKQNDATPQHPGINHLLMIYLERSANPDEALKYGKYLSTHFPSMSSPSLLSASIHLQQGLIHDAMNDVEQALATIARTNHAFKSQGFTALTHFRTQAALYQQWELALYEGRSELAQDLAAQLHELTRADQIDSNTDLQFYLAPEWMNIVYFKNWSKALTLKEPAKQHPLAKGLWYLTAALAFLERDQLAEVLLIEKNLRGLAAQIKGRSSLSDEIKAHLALHLTLLQASYADKQQNSFHAHTLWQQARAQIHSLPIYAQPLYQLFVEIRLAQSHVALSDLHKAASSLNDYLALFPHNPWAMYMLSGVYTQRKLDPQAKQVMTDVKEHWHYADIEEPQF